MVDLSDAHHAACVAAARRVRAPLGTVWPAVAEAMHLLSDTSHGRDRLWEMLARPAIQILPLERADFPRIQELMRKYQDLPMDLADASLICVAEREGIDTFFTLDRRDFSIYRLHGRVKPTIIP
jgi:uncharacterized protein